MNEFRRVVRPGAQAVIKTHERPLVCSFPEDPHLQPLIEQFVDTILSGWRSIRLPSLFTDAGFNDIEIDIERDTIWTVLGAIDDSRRSILEDVFVGPIQRQAHLFGGDEKARSFLAEWLAYLERNDTNTITTSWVVKGRVPANASAQGNV